MLRSDLKAAEIFRDASGRVVDFHALRHTFISNIVLSPATGAVDGRMHNALEKCGLTANIKVEVLPAPVAQLDRASVFGTDSHLPQRLFQQSDTISDDSARSICAAPGSKKASEGLTSDPQLAQLIEAWPGLPEPIKAAIVVMVNNSG